MAAADRLSILRQEIYVAAQAFFDYGMNQEERSACVSKFKALDENGDGRVSSQELGNMSRIMDPSLAVRVCRFSVLVDREGNGFLDFDECKSLFFLIAKGRICDLCNGLIIHGGVSCLDCSPVYFDLCFYCFSDHRHSRGHNSFRDLPPLTSSSSRQIKLPPVHRVVAQQDYHQFKLPSSHEVVAQQAPPLQHNTQNNSRGFVQDAVEVASFLNNVCTVLNLIDSCATM